MGWMRWLVVAAGLFSVSCTTWFINFDSGRARKRWLSCAGRCDPAFETLATKEDTQLALTKLTYAIDNTPAYERAIIAAIHWDRAILLEVRGEWLAALGELDAAVAQDPAAMYAEERALVRRRLGIPAEAPPGQKRDADGLAQQDEDEIHETCACPAGLSEEPPNEATMATLVEPGKGIGPIVIDRSTLDDVMRVYGCDCRVSKRRRDNAIVAVDYSFIDAKGGLGTASHLPSRIPNATRPAVITFVDGRVKRIALNIYQKNLATAGGVHVRGTKADMTRAFGDGFSLQTTRHYEKYRYRELGIDIWISHANDTIGAIHIWAP